MSALKKQNTENPDKVLDDLEQKFKKSKNSAKDWLDGKISLGKMLQNFDVPRMQGEELAGSIWQAFEERIQNTIDELENKAALAEKWKKEASDNCKQEDFIAESAKFHAFKESKHIVQFKLWSAIKNTQQG